MRKKVIQIADRSAGGCLKKVAGVGFGLALGALAGILAGLLAGVGIALILGIL